MRRVFIITALIAAAAGPALGAQDRYGPPRTPSPSEAYSQRPEALAPWARRLAGPAAPAPRAPPTPEPLAPWAKRLSPAPLADRLPPPADHPQPMAMRPAAMQPAAAQRPVAARPTPASTEPRFAPPTPQPMPARPTPFASHTTPVATAAAPGATGRPRFYSVSRQYGGQPDPIPHGAPARGEALNLAETPSTPQLSRSTAALDDVPIADTKRNAAAARTSRLGL